MFSHFVVVNDDILLYNLLFSGFPAHNLKILWNCSIYIYLLSVYSLFSDRIGLPLHNIPAPFL